MQTQKIRSTKGAMRVASLLSHLDRLVISPLAGVVGAALPGLGYAAVPVPVRVQIRYEGRRPVRTR